MDLTSIYQKYLLRLDCRRSVSSGSWTTQSRAITCTAFSLRILHPTPYALHPTPYTLHPTPYALHPIPYTSHPTPYNLHPSPYSLQPKPHNPNHILYFSPAGAALPVEAGQSKAKNYTASSLCTPHPYPPTHVLIRQCFFNWVLEQLDLRAEDTPPFHSPP